MSSRKRFEKRDKNVMSSSYLRIIAYIFVNESCADSFMILGVLPATLEKHYYVDHATAQIARGSQYPTSCNWPPDSTR